MFGEIDDDDDIHSNNEIVCVAEKENEKTAPLAISTNNGEAGTNLINTGGSSIEREIIHQDTNYNGSIDQFDSLFLLSSLASDSCEGSRTHVEL